MGRLPPIVWAGIVAVVVLAAAITFGLLTGPGPAPTCTSSPGASTSPTACPTSSTSPTG